MLFTLCSFSMNTLNSYSTTEYITSATENSIEGEPKSKVKKLERPEAENFDDTFDLIAYIEGQDFTFPEDIKYSKPSQTNSNKDLQFNTESNPSTNKEVIFTYEQNTRLNEIQEIISNMGKQERTKTSKKNERLHLIKKRSILIQNNQRLILEK